MKNLLIKVKGFLRKAFEFIVNLWHKLVGVISRFYNKSLKKPLYLMAYYTGLVWLAKKYRHLSNKTKRAVTGLLFILPWLIGLFIFGLSPIIRSIRMAMANEANFIVKIINEETGESIRKYVIKGFGFTQFEKIFTKNPTHVETIVSFLKDIALIVPIVMIFSLILALLLNQKIKGKGLFRVIFFIPVILLSGSMLSYFDQFNLLTVPAIQNGTIAESMRTLFPAFLSEILVSAFGRIVLILWLSGVQTLIFLAGLQKMDSAIYEAAEVDGASMWETFWKITLPSLMPLMYINIIYTTVIYTNLGSFNPIINLISNLPVASYGEAYQAALSWILFGIDLLVISVYSLIVKLSSIKYN